MQFLSLREENKEFPELKRIKPQVPVDKIVDVISKEFECEKDYIIQKGRKRNLARDITIYLLRDICGKSVKSLGEYFGGISGAAITLRYNFIDNKLCKDGKMEKKIDKIKNQILNN